MVLMNSVLLKTVIDRCKRGSLEEAILLASIGHFGQRDRGKTAYIEHPIAVMMRCRHFDEATQTVAILHDLVEDNPYFTVEVLRLCGFSDVVIEALEYLKRPKEMSVLEAAERLAERDIRREAVVIAMRVRIADNAENSNISRISNPKPMDVARCATYQQSLQIVSKALSRLQ